MGYEEIACVIKLIEKYNLNRKEEVLEARVSLDEIKHMADTARRDGARNKEELRAWMARKRHKQMQEYKQHLDELREREARPFRPTQENLDQVQL